MIPLAYTPAQAAEALSVSRTFFDQHIKPDLKIVYVGARVLIPVQSITDWLHAQAVRVA